MVTKAFFDESGMKSADKVTASSTHTAQQYPAQTQTQNQTQTQTQTQPQSSQHAQQATGQNAQVVGSPQPYYPTYYGQQAPHQAAPHQPPHQAPHHHVPPSYYPGYTNGAYINAANSEGYSYTQNQNQHKTQSHGMAPPKAHYQSPSTGQGSSTPAKATNVPADKSVVSMKIPKDDFSIILTTIKENDVTHGKGSSFNHKGNEKYRNCLKKYYKNYVIADAHGQTSIATQIHREITDQVPGGRFLVYNHKRSGWELMPIKEATEYIQHVLNDCEIREKKRLAERRTVEGTKPAKKQRTANNYDNPAAVITIDDGLHEESEERISAKDNSENEFITEMNDKSCGSQESSRKEEKFPSRHCDTCLGTGLLPVPEALAPFTKSWPIAEVNFPMTAQFPQQLENPLIPHGMTTAAPKVAYSTEIGSADNNQGTNEDAATSSNDPHSVFASNLRLIEETWGITNGSELTYPERVQQLEERTQNQRRTIATETAFLQNDHVLQILEEAERKWGIDAPEGFNLGDRVELVEKTAFNFMSRLQVWL
jgi:hypothetical protein